jgi:hypothetical protein
VEEKKKRMSFKRRVFLMAVGYCSLALDKLEGKPTRPSKSATKGRIKIVG